MMQAKEMVFGVVAVLIINYRKDDSRLNFLEVLKW